MRPASLMLAVALAVPALCWQADTSGQRTPKQTIKDLRDYARQGSPAIPKIEPFLRDAEVEVRREAVKALVTAGTQRSLEPLVAACLDNDSEVQIRAVDGLVNFYLPGYADRGFSASLRRAGNTLSGKFDDPTDAAVDPDTPMRPEIVQSLSGLVRGGSSMESRANAARAIGVLRARDGIPALLDSLRSKDSRLMFESLVALGKIRDRAAGPRAAFLVRDLDEKVQVAAIETAGILVTREALPDLNRVLESSPGKKVRRAALNALAQIADPSSKTMFLGLLNDRDDDARAAAAEGVGRLGALEARAALEKAFAEERRAPVRLAQSFGLALLGNTGTGNLEPVGHLKNTLNQRAWRGVAQPYLSELALKSGPRAAILQALGHAATRDEKTGIAQALAECNSSDAVAPLERLAKDEDATVAREALRALRILKGALR